jgi:dimethylglycine dehydrogenase
VFETTSFGRYLVEGPKAEAFLRHLLAGAIPKPGRVTLTPMLTPSGRILGDFTLARLAPDRFWLFGSGPAEGVHLRWFEAQLPASGVQLRSLRSELTGLALAGPRSRDLLARLAGEDVSNAAFPFRQLRPMELAGVPAVVVRLSFTGELGYEIWCAPEFQRRLFDAVCAAGEDLGLRPFGARALDSLRLEKGFGAFGREHTRDRTPFETGLDRFVQWDRADFIGREALLPLRERPPARRIQLFAVAAEDADCCGNEPVLADGVPVGRVTSGGFGHTVGQSLALAFVDVAAVEAAAELAIEILGVPRRATRLRRHAIQRVCACGAEA